MSVSSVHIVRQAPVLAALGQAAFGAAFRRLSGRTPAPLTLPGPEVEMAVSPRAPSLLRDYIRHVGGQPSSYRGQVPPHLFPQWGFALASKLLADVDYPLQRALNAGCRLEVNGPLPSDRTLTARARLESIDDNGRRALLHERVATGTSDEPELVVGHMYVLVPLGGGSAGNGSPAVKKEKARVPHDARELAYWRIGASAGLDFAKLTGDFNPVHWVRPYARAFGFRNTILHGFSTMARAYEGLVGNLLSGDVHALSMLDVQFTSPLVLPASVGLYLVGDQVFVGDAPGGRAYLTGRFALRGAA